MSIGHINAQGQYVKGKKAMGHDVSSQWKSWSHENQRKRFDGDLLQPFNSDGTPSREFIATYPKDVTEKYFKPEQIEKAERDLGGLR
jgi:hypothetical protein